MAVPPVFVSGQVLTAAQMNAVGLWEVKSGSFSAVSALNVDNAFTSDYANYRLMLKLTANSSTTTINLRMRASGTDSSASYYFSGIGGNLAGTAATVFPGSSNTSSATIGLSSVTIERSIELDFINPQLAERTFFHGFYIDWTGVVNYAIGGAHGVQTAYDGFTILPGSGGTITGSYIVYGYRN